MMWAPTGHHDNNPNRDPDAEVLRKLRMQHSALQRPQQLKRSEYFMHRGSSHPTPTLER